MTTDVVRIRRPILCLDFDGVIHSYSSGWQGAGVANDPPVPGAIEFMQHALQFFRVAIFSSRSNQQGGIECMATYIAHAAMSPEDKDPPAWQDQIEYPTEKPPAFLTLDDRAITFDGIWPDPKSLLEFKPWNK
jgi:hypothetical protein